MEKLNIEFCDVSLVVKNIYLNFYEEKKIVCRSDKAN